MTKLSYGQEPSSVATFLVSLLCILLVHLTWLVFTDHQNVVFSVRLKCKSLFTSQILKKAPLK